MLPVGRLAATLTVLVGSVLMLAYVAITPTHPLFAIVTPAALLPVAYVVDTATHRRVDDLTRREGAMLAVAILAVLLAAVAFSVTTAPLYGLASAVCALSVALVVANWWSRRVRRSGYRRT